MGNMMPCGGDSSNGSSPGRGGLLTANMSGFSSRSSGSFHENGKHQDANNAQMSLNWRRSDYINLRQLRLKRPKLRVVLGIAKHHQQYDSIKWALDRLAGGHIDCAYATNTDAALSACREATKPNLVILDARNSRNLDAEMVARSVRQSVRGDHVVLVAIVKKSYLEREEVAVANHLAVGFNRVLCDSLNRGYWLNELVQLLHNDVDTHLKLQCVDTLFATLDGCSDIVQITDQADRIQFVNTASEKILGYSREEIVDKNLWDYQSTMGLSDLVLSENESGPSMKGTDLIRQKLDHGKRWEGPLNCKRRTGDVVALDARIIPVAFSSKCADQVIYIKQPPPLLRDKALTEVYDQFPTNRRSLKSFNKTASSCDPGSIAEVNPSNALRRQSATKLHSISIEAPITKVINILLAAQENSPIYVAQALDKVVEILQTTASGSSDLFSPELDKERKQRRTDPVATDLLGALLANSTRDVLYARRSSNDIGKVHSHTAHRPSVPTIDNLSAQTRQLLENSHLWDFDIIELEKITEKRCLVWLGMTTFLRFEVHKTLNCTESTLQNWLTLIEANYNQNNTYHNSTHAADVLHATAYFVEQEKMKDFCDAVDEATCLIAAVIHDVDHPGRNSAFLCNSGSELANLYNDITVLENHHAALGFKLTTSDDRVNIFKNLDRDTYKLMRQSVIDMVLATDMSKHFVHVNKFASVYGKVCDEGEGGISMPLPPSDSGDTSPSLSVDGILATPENVAILKRMLIKCADVSNPARPFSMCREWAFRIAEEYFTQTDDEKRLGLQVVMPQFDRSTCSIPKSQIGFYDFFIHDMFGSLTSFIDMPELIEHIGKNYEYWKSEEEKESLEKKEKSDSIPSPVIEEEREEVEEIEREQREEDEEQQYLE